MPSGFRRDGLKNNAVMGRQNPNVDTQVASLALAAKKLASEKGITPVAAFLKITKDIAHAPPAWREVKPSAAVEKASWEKALWLPPSAEEKRHAREWTLRFDLEAAVLRLDACCQPAPRSTMTYPTSEELKALSGAVDEFSNLLSKRVPRMPWPRWEKADHYFPKLRLCKRVTSFVDRLAENTPPRPFGALARHWLAGDYPLVTEFCVSLSETRNGRDTDTVDWSEFKKVLLLCQDAMLQREGKAPWSQLRKQGARAIPPVAEPLIAFLELDRLDLLWLRNHGVKLWNVLRWTDTLDNEDILRRLDRLDRESPEAIELKVKRIEEMKIAVRRILASCRKAKSRKNLGKKV